MVAQNHSDIPASGVDEREAVVRRALQRFDDGLGGTDDGEPEYAKFPTKEQQTAYCAAYLAEMGGASDEAAVAALVEESAQFVLADHWYWGLWAVNQARDEGCEEFPYLTYAQRRIGQYYAIIEGRA